MSPNVPPRDLHLTLAGTSARQSQHHESMWRVALPMVKPSLPKKNLGELYQLFFGCDDLDLMRPDKKSEGAMTRICKYREISPDRCNRAITYRAEKPHTVPVTVRPLRAAEWL